MPSSKYDRELRFIDNEVGRLNRKLKSMVDAVPDTPSEAAKKADEILGVKEKISELVTRKRRSRTPSSRRAWTSPTSTGA